MSMPYDRDPRDDFWPACDACGDALLRDARGWKCERCSDGECDVCGARVARLHCVEAYGIETYACDGCCGREAEEGA